MQCPALQQRTVNIMGASQHKRRAKPQRRRSESKSITVGTGSPLSPFLTIKEACEYFGGSRPLDPSTYWRGVKRGYYPSPKNVGPGIKRILKSECDARVARLAAEGN
jgi:hypothetical protein